MVAKLAVVILVLGGTFAALLVNRQQRIDVVAEISRAHLRMDAHSRVIQRLHADVAKAVQPAELQAALARLPEQFQPIPYRFDPFAGKGKARLAHGDADESPSRAESLRKEGGG